ncbi:hypothetical protein V493_00027 [Pseudogymnoascus sp. VKM F-4281 (FW-2241)]|nr:hypothetical protein V493_00027 [Pseudogymnoascus sp. VKM F-4281 (FW-2241)]
MPPLVSFENGIFVKIGRTGTHVQSNYISTTIMESGAEVQRRREQAEQNLELQRRLEQSARERRGHQTQQAPAQEYLFKRLFASHCVE